MLKSFKVSLLGCLMLLVDGCSNNPVAYNPLDDFEQLDPTTIFALPEAVPSSNYTPEQLQRSRYMVGLLGCGSCHTDCALAGAANQSRLLAGSGTGIAYTSPFVDTFPGIVYPPNLTPDMETGLGSWTMNRLVQMIRVGTSDHSSRSIPVMPWPAFVSITEEDAFAIAAYLKSLTPVRHQVPANVSRGQRASAPFVHFGVYQSR
ncbi:MAG: cytochrome C [Gammaproteobacteria bacterium]|nr:cytochrome C [Gammaproteobacteria bacterium]